ncbi:MAG TPA: hypothetical protein PLK53_06225 [Bacillota bacterium]|nr:hypothetical protein [Bacillota bacterium]
MKLRKLCTVLLIAFCIAFSSAPISAASTGVTAKPTNSSVFINGTSVNFTAYNIGGNNYFKLRDLAAALNNTEKKFSVRYDGASKRIYLETGQIYSPIGGELETNANPAPKTASPTSETLFCNNVNIRCAAYKIDGANYFKLRDIMKVMDIGVTWDSTRNSIQIDTGQHYVYENGILTGTTLPELRIKGDWPMPQRSLQTFWAKSYPVYATYLGLPTKILTEGITWEWDATITPDTVGYYAETNSFKMGPLPHHNNFDVHNHEDYEPLYLQNMHETAHLFWQMGDMNLDYEFGQWIWEASALIAETLYKLDYYDEYVLEPVYDLKANLGPDRVNGVMSDGNKFGSAGRTMVDGNSTEALTMLASVMSYDSGYDYFAHVNEMRVKHYNETGNASISKDAYSRMLDIASNGRTMDGMRPSEWLFSQPVANTDGAEGVYLTVVPIHPWELRDNAIVLETALYRRFVDSRGDKMEEPIAGTSIDLKLFDSSSRLIAQTTQTSSNGQIESVDLVVGSSLPKGAYRIEGHASVSGKDVVCTTYFISLEGRMSNDQVALILLKSDGTIDAEAGSNLTIKGANTVDRSAVSKGLIVLTADEGADISLSRGSSNWTISKPYGSRIVPIKIK